MYLCCTTFLFSRKKMLFSCCINFFLNFFFDTTFELLTNITIPWVSTALNCWIIIRPSNRILIEINEDFWSYSGWISKEFWSKYLQNSKTLQSQAVNDTIQIFLYVVPIFFQIPIVFMLYNNVLWKMKMLYNIFKLFFMLFLCCTTYLFFPFFF